MNLVLELTPDVESALRKQAEQQGTTPEILAVQTLHERFTAPPPGLGEQSAYEALKPLIGVLHSGKSDLSQNTGERFTKIVAEKFPNNRCDV